MFEVRIKGFKTIDAAILFAAWFEGQGENDIVDWWESEESIGSPPMVKEIQASTNVITVVVEN